MMLDGERFPFASTADYEAVELPYGGQAFAMTVVLPRPGTSVETVAARLDDGAWASLVGSLAEADLTLFLPKFRLEYEKALNDVLTALGMGITFDPHQADFTLMHARAREIELHISKVKQKSFIQVDEEGTEAAAATSVEMGVTSAGPVVRVDRPFLFAIRERLSGTILFLGRITDPS
jgi:serpin B